MDKVTQADRNAAAKWVAPCYPGKHSSGFADDIAHGRADEGALVQAFAAHRRQAEEAMRERCAKVADAHDSDGWSAAADAADAIAAAIRSMEVE